MSDFRFQVNEKVLVIGKATIVKITAAYRVEARRYYAVDKFPGFLIREDCLQSLERPAPK